MFTHLYAYVKYIDARLRRLMTQDVSRLVGQLVSHSVGPSVSVSKKKHNQTKPVFCKNVKKIKHGFSQIPLVVFSLPYQQERI